MEYNLPLGKIIFSYFTQRFCIDRLVGLKTCLSPAAALYIRQSAVDWHDANWCSPTHYVVIRSRALTDKIVQYADIPSPQSPALHYISYTTHILRH